MQVKIRRLRPSAQLPQYATEGSAGMDLCADTRWPVLLYPHGPVLVGTGIAISLPGGFEAQVRPRSGLALKHAITVLNSPGTIDRDYVGEIGVILSNAGEDVYEVNPGDRIAQLVIAPVSRVEWEEVEELEETERGSGSFGSTGR